MPNIQHATLTGADLHEPKGVASADEGSIYIADGAGSGTWTDVNTVAHYVVSGVIEDISTATTVYVPMPESGEVKQLTTVLGGPITVADATVTAKNTAGTSMGSVTVTQSGSAIGDVDTVATTSNNTFSANTFITVETDGASTDAAKLYFSLLVERS